MDLLVGLSSCSCSSPFRRRDSLVVRLDFLRRLRGLLVLPVDLDSLVALPFCPSEVGLQGLVLLLKVGYVLEVIPYRVEREIEDHSCGNADTDPEQNLPGYIETEQLE